MANVLSWVASITAITYAGITALLFVGQRHLMYMPTAENRAVNEDSIQLHSGSETIKIWRIGNGINALVYFGGNAEDVAENIPEFNRYFPKHTVYLVNYRGYGGSTGKPTESALFEDALNVYDKVSESHENISVIGRSLGSAVAIYLASQRVIKKLVVVTPFDSALNLAKGMYPVFPVSLLLKDRFDAVGQINTVQAPILALVAEQDTIIPRKRTDALINAIPTDQLTVQVISNTGHNDILNSTAYAEALVSFIGNDIN